MDEIPQRKLSRTPEIQSEIISHKKPEAGVPGSLTQTQTQPIQKEARVEGWGQLFRYLGFKAQERCCWIRSRDFSKFEELGLQCVLRQQQSPQVRPCPFQGRT